MVWVVLPVGSDRPIRLTEVGSSVYIAYCIDAEPLKVSMGSFTA
jgi:hypothetical protein